MNLFGGKLTGGIFAVIGAIISVILIGIMAGPFGSLVAYFADSASDGDGSRFSRLYSPVSGDATPGQYQINTDTNRAGGSGYPVAENSAGGVQVRITAESAITAAEVRTFYNEQGDPVSVYFATEVSANETGTGRLGSTASDTTYVWASPPEAFGKLNFLNRILVTILALVAAIGLIMKVKNSYDAFQRGGTTDLTPVVLMEVTTMVLALVGVYFTPTFLDILGNTAIVYTSGQFDFSFVGNILEIVFAILPTMLLVSLMGLVSSEQVQGRILGAGKRAIGGVGRISSMRPRPRRRMA